MSSPACNQVSANKQLKYLAPGEQVVSASINPGEHRHSNVHYNIYYQTETSITCDKRHHQAGVGLGHHHNSNNKVKERAADCAGF